MDLSTIWLMARPLLETQTRHLLGLAFGYLLAHGVLAPDQQGPFTEIGMAIAGYLVISGWSLWNTVGKKRLAALLMQVTGASSTKEAIQVAKGTADAAPAAAAGPVAVKMLLLAIGASMIISLVLASSALAQTRVPLPPPAPAKCLIPYDPLKLCGALTGKPDEDLQRVATRIGAVTKIDLVYAMAKAKRANSYSSHVRLQCLQAISDFKDQIEGFGLKNEDGSDMVRPNPAVISAIEDLAELIDSLSPQGALQTSCAGAAQLFKVNTLEAVNGLVTGALALAAKPAALAF